MSAAVCAAVLALACGGIEDPADPWTGPAHQDIRVMVSPESASTVPGGAVELAAAVTGTAITDVTWEVEEGPSGGTVSPSGVYSAPAAEGTFHVRVTSVVDPTKAARATMSVTAEPPPPPPTTPPPPPATTPALPAGTFAFPGCEGAGCGSVGGRGGTVYKVTNLANAGTGSLRACVQASGPRTCVFTVGGKIELTSELSVTNPYLTIAGQTAPGGGIEVVGLHQGGYVFSVRTHDVTVRYVRFFNNAPPCGASSQGCGVVRVLPPARSVVLDHLTTAYTQDENLSVWSSGVPGPRDITVSWVLNAYPLADHPTGTNIGGGTPANSAATTDIDFHHNFYANVGHRIFGGGAKSVRWAYNVAFNYGWYALRTGMGVVDDFVGNVYRCGSQSDCSFYPFTLGVFETGWPAGTPSIYVHNNVWKTTTKAVKVAGDLSDAAQWPAMVCMVQNSSVSAACTGTAPAGYRRATPSAPPAAGTAIAAGPAGPYSGFVLTADGANLEKVMFDASAAGDAARGTPYGPVGPSRRLDCEGNLVNNMDGVLQRAIAEYVGGGDETYAPSAGSRRPVRQTDICWAPGQCGVPSLAAGVSCADRDEDGMPDGWESRWGLDPTSATGDHGANGRRLSAGYTNLEVYLSGHAGY